MLFSHDLVTLADVFFKLSSIENPDVGPGVTNQSVLLQVLGGVGHALAPHSQHVRNELLRHL